MHQLAAFIKGIKHILFQPAYQVTPRCRTKACYYWLVLRDLKTDIAKVPDTVSDDTLSFIDAMSSSAS